MNRTKILSRIDILVLMVLFGLVNAGCAAFSKVTNPLIVTEEHRQEAENLTKTVLPFYVSAAIYRYLDQPEPIYFLVANDGGHTLSRGCLEPPCHYDGEEELDNARQDCAELRLGMDCSLLYIRKHLLSDNLRFKTKLTYKYLTGEKYIPPRKALGKIIYLPGFSGWFYGGYNFPPAITDTEISPVLENLENLGWDVDILNILHLDRAYSWDDPELIANLINQLIDGARANGYQKVILFGGSRGGAEIMKAVISGSRPDTIALMEPDWHGPKFSGRGSYNEDHDIREKEIVELLGELPSIRVAFSYFSNSRWYGDIDPAQIENALEKINSNYLLIAAPEKLTGHGGSWTYRFANSYTECLHRYFLGETEGGVNCNSRNLNEDDRKNWVVNSHITSGNFRKLSGSELKAIVSNKAFCPYIPNEDSESLAGCQLWNDIGRIKSFENEFGHLIITNDLIEFKPFGFCRHNGMYSPTYRCSDVYLIEEDLLAILPRDRENFYWYRAYDRDAVVKHQSSARYYCRNTNKLKHVTCGDI